MINGNILIRIGFGLLFIWGGLEKFFEGFLGGVGLQNVANFLQAIGFSFLGDTGSYILGIVLAALELIAGVALLTNKKLFESYAFLAFIMLVALVLVHIPSGSWMNSMIHLSLVTTLAGLSLNSRQQIR